MIKGIIFDFDGTLMDSNAIHRDAFKEVFKEYGIKVDEEKLVERFGIPGTLIMRELTNLTEDQIKEAMKREVEIARKNATEKGFPKESIQVIEVLKEMGYKVSIVTGGYISYVSSIVPEGLVNIIYGAESPVKPKPAPDMLYASAKDMGLEKDECVFIGDSSVDAQAAKAGNIKFIGIGSPLSREELEDENPEIIIEKISEVLNIFDEYPKDL